MNFESDILPELNETINAGDKKNQVTTKCMSSNIAKNKNIIALNQNLIESLEFLDTDVLKTIYFNRTLQNKQLEHYKILTCNNLLEKNTILLNIINNIFLERETIDECKDDHPKKTFNEKYKTYLNKTFNEKSLGELEQKKQQYEKEIQLLNKYNLDECTTVLKNHNTTLTIIKTIINEREQPQQGWVDLGGGGVSNQKKNTYKKTFRKRHFLKKNTFRHFLGKSVRKKKKRHFLKKSVSKNKKRHFLGKNTFRHFLKKNTFRKSVGKKRKSVVKKNSKNKKSVVKKKSKNRKGQS